MTGKSRVSLYCAGGLGINVAFQLLKYPEEAQARAGYAEIDIFMVDTSTSNLRLKTVDKEKLYLVEGLDGSGKIRAENHKEIAECVTEIFLKHPPGDLSIVISSLSGGSGSVIAPSLVSELLAKGHNVIVVGVASSESRLEMENSIKTMKSYENIATKRNKPLTMYYLDNSSSASRAANDAMICETVLGLSVLFSGQNAALDGSDLRNWLNYDRVTSFPPKLMYLTTNTGAVTTEKAFVVSVATLAEEGGEEGSVDTPEYRCVGYVPSALVTGNGTDKRITLPYHYIILDGVVASIAADLSTSLKKLDEVNKAKRRFVGSIVDETDGVGSTDDGLIL